MVKSQSLPIVLPASFVPLVLIGEGKGQLRPRELQPHLACHSLLAMEMSTGIV